MGNKLTKIELEKETKFDGTIYFWCVSYSDYKTSYMLGQNLTDEEALKLFNDKCQDLIQPRIEVLKTIEIE